ncbi:response regulator [Epibacterium sp. SM1969]|uniref:Response regulator n=1 Tax=Tritonibacter aquimaris TaxID=2663379 RepID=A0A844AT27_9RHOB|nr:sigma-54 dependent transcriptional regulator [Tritonibacter aquimaris]MQY41181.1 response regulator [Tritonibacter aquimaris]
MTRKVLLVDDDAAVREALGQTLELNDITSSTHSSFVAAKDQITADFPGVIISDIRMPGRDGFHLLEYALEIDPDLPVILLTGEGDIPMAVRAMSQGAFDFLEKPCASADLLAVLERALNTRKLVLENRELKQTLERGDAAARMIFGVSEQSQDLRARVRSVASTQAEVLVTGAPGGGLSKVAEVIHIMSTAAQGPFVKQAAHRVTADDFPALCKRAAGGSLYLDEIKELSPEAQYAVLELLENPHDVRILAGTTVDLIEQVNSQNFNADLFYRLDVMRVRIPPLSERPSDIPDLFRHYVAQAAEQAGIQEPEVSQEHLASLMAQEWPGNARSLMSAAMRFVLGMPEEAVEAAELGLAEQMAQVERSLLIAALGRQNGRAAAAAEVLKLPRKTLYDKLARYGIRPEDYRR